SKLDEANALLQPYLDGRLQRLHNSEKAYENTLTRARDNAIELVNKGLAPDFPMERYRRARAAEKRTIEQEDLHEKLKDNETIQTAEKNLVKESGVVPVAIDYGIVLLRRAEGMRDVELRRAELEKAKKTFLAIRGVAGQDDAYRMFLGQVHYWLGEPAEGRNLFDELLESQKRSFQV